MEDIDKLLGLEGLRSTNVENEPGKDGKESTQIDCVPIVKPPCPWCGSFYCHVYGHLIRTVQDLDCCGKRLYLRIHMDRYICMEPNPDNPSGICGKTFQPEIEMIDQNARLTKRFRNVLAEESLTIPFKQVGEKYGLSLMTLKRASTSYFEEKDQWRKENLYCPTGIGLDENHLNGKYCLVVTDNDQHTLLDILNNKDPETVQQVLEDLKEKDNLQ